jgi:hypothetical protein
MGCISGVLKNSQSFKELSKGNSSFSVKIKSEIFAYFCRNRVFGKIEGKLLILQEGLI